MFEVFKRFGKFLKYGLQGVTAIATVIMLYYNKSDEGLAIILFLGGSLLIGIIEVLARAVVWIISGYFETNSKANISLSKLKQMREYYTYYHLRKTLLKILNKCNSENP